MSNNAFFKVSTPALACSCCSSLSSSHTCLSLSPSLYSPHSVPWWGEAHGAAAWWRQCAREPPQTTRGESDRWHLTWQPGGALEPGAALLRCPLPAVDPVLKDATGPPLLLPETHTHSRRPDVHYYTRRTHLSHPCSHLPNCGWEVFSGRRRGGRGRWRRCQRLWTQRGAGGADGECWGTPAGTPRLAAASPVSPRRTLIPCMFSATLVLLLHLHGCWGFWTSERADADEGRTPSWFHNRTASTLILLNNVNM